MIKISPGGESAGGGRSTSKSTCVVPAWTLTAFGDRPASSMSKFSTSVNSDLGNGSFSVGRTPWRWACRSSSRSMELKIYATLIVWTDLRPHRCLLLGYACTGRVWKQFRCLRLSLLGGLLGSTATSALVDGIWCAFFLFESYLKLTSNINEVRNNKISVSPCKTLMPFIRSRPFKLSQHWPLVSAAVTVHCCDLCFLRSLKLVFCDRRATSEYFASLFCRVCKKNTEGDFFL